MNNFKIESSILNHIDYIKDLEFKFYNQIKNEFKMKLENIDKEVLESKWRIDNGWIVHEKNIKRTIITKFGEVTFGRTKYKNKFNGKCSFLADPYMEIGRYQRISFSLEKEILESFGNGESHITVWKKFDKANLTKRTISNILSRRSKYKIENFILKQKTNIISKDIIYVDIDDCWSTVRYKKNKKWLRLRVAVAHQGKIKEGKRNKLLNKTAFIKTFIKGVNCNTQDYSFWLKNNLEKQYGDLTKKKIIICGDGAKWIKEISEILGCDYVLDKFHLFQKLYLCFPYKKSSKKLFNLYQKAKEYYDSKNIEALLNFLIENIDSNINKSLKIKEAIRYIKNNYKGIKNHYEEWYRGCNAESAVSHLIKSIKGYGAKLYSKNSFEFLINLKIASINKINISTFLYEKDKENLEKFIEENKSLKNKNNNIYNTKKFQFIKSANIPILNQKTSGTNIKIRKLLFS